MADTTTAAQKVVRDALNGVGPVSEAIAKGVDWWLSTVVIWPAAHQLAILTSAQLNGGKKIATNAISTINNATSVLDYIISAAGTAGLSELMPEAVEILNKEAQILQDPNIEGIPISTDSIKCSRHVDVSESQVILQNVGTSNAVVDNAVPHPRSWQITGYFTSTSKIDYFYLIKPTLIIQTQLMDAFATSRKPVWFKDGQNRFHKVQIEDFSYEQEPRSTTTLRVTIQLKEYSPLLLGKSISDIINMNKVAQ